MGIPVSWFLNLRVGDVLTDIQNQQVGRTEGQVVVLQRVPLGTHYGVGTLVSLLPIQERRL